MKPEIIKPFSDDEFSALRVHVDHIRRAFDAPGAVYHDVDACPENKFNRWQWHNLPMLVEMHHDPKLIAQASQLAGQPLKPSYVFLSMYGPDGVCPLHTDRPQCQFTIDLQVRSNGAWPIFVDEKPYILNDGQALFYSGTGQPHYRRPMHERYVETISPMHGGTQPKPLVTPTFMDLAFFHFVPTAWMGNLG